MSSTGTGNYLQFKLYLSHIFSRNLLLLTFAFLSVRDGHELTYLGVNHNTLDFLLPFYNAVLPKTVRMWDRKVKTLYKT